MRVFLAVCFPWQIKEYLAQVQHEVKKISQAGSFTRSENFHLTLRFIGEVAYKDIEGLRQAIDRTVVACDSFPLRLQLGKLGSFVQSDKQVIWLGLKPNYGLDFLYERLQEELEREGYPRERRSFSPHITLGRQVVLSRKVPSVVKEQKAFCVEGISLMESVREGGRLFYHNLYTRPGTTQGIRE